MPPHAAYPLKLTTTWLTAHRRDIAGRKLPRYLLVTHEGSSMGSLEYYPPWHKFTLVPLENTAWDSTCLTEIARLCDDLTMLQRILARSMHGAMATVPEEE